MSAREAVAARSKHVGLSMRFLSSNAHLGALDQGCHYVPPWHSSPSTTSSQRGKLFLKRCRRITSTYLLGAEKSRIANRRSDARGHIVVEALVDDAPARAIVVVVKVKVAALLVGAVTAVDDGLGRLVVGHVDPRALALVVGARCVSSRGDR